MNCLVLFDIMLRPERYIEENTKEKEEVNDKEFILAALNRLMFPDRFNITKFCHDFGIHPTYFHKVRKDYNAAEGIGVDSRQ